MSDDRDIYLDDKAVRDLSMNWEMACSLCFSNDDIFERPIEDAHPEIREMARDWYNGEDKVIRYLYAPAGKVRRRMELQGYTREACRALWEVEFEQHIARAESLAGSYPEFDREISAQKGLTFEAWEARVAGLDVEQMLRFGGVHMFSFSDMFAQLALTLELARPQVVWIEIGEDMNFDPALSLHENLNRDQDAFGIPFIEPTGNVLILTEGRSDTHILSRAIKSFYPEFADMYEFVDFEEFRIEGGVSLVTKTIKAFAGVRMRQRILAIFDNDAAGIEQRELLASTIRLPPSIKVMVSPDLELARNYPTIGPEGLRSMDVNGSATSIELFLGRDALAGTGGGLRPVRWTSWNKSAKRYQGELEDKSSATDVFLAQLKLNRDPERLRREFPDMDDLLLSIFHAFG